MVARVAPAVVAVVLAVTLSTITTAWMVLVAMKVALAATEVKVQAEGCKAN